MVRTIEFTVNESSVTPTARQFAGVAGEHNATQLVFTIESTLFSKIQSDETKSEELKYRFDCYDSCGALYSTESAPLTSDPVSLPLGENITRLGGEAKIVLVVTLLNAESKTEMELLSVPVAVYFKGVPFESGTLDKSRESLTSLEQSAKRAAEAAEQSAENAENNAVAASGSALSAAASANAALSSATAADSAAEQAQTAADEATAQKISAEEMLSTHNTDPAAHPDIKRIYIQSAEPENAQVGDLWIDTSEESGGSSSGSSGGSAGTGADGFSPIVEVTEIEGGHTVSITDAEGTTSFNVMNGQDGIDGSDGKDGADGKDGVSATHSWDGTVLTITSASGTSSADLKGAKGDTGEKGEKGATGAAGYTPVKGTDYFTAEDKAALVDDLIEETGIDITPDYVITEAEGVIDRVIAAQTGRVFTFAAITDMHYGNDSYTDGIKHACQALKYIDSRIKLDAVAVLGDYTDGYLTTAYDDAIADFKGINGLLSGLRFAPNLRQQGNHDFYAVHSPLTHRFIQAQSDDVVWGDKLGGYFYKDFEDYKLRVISINANEENGIDDDNKPIGHIACSVEQYNWFISSLDLTAKEDVPEWQILILSHQPLDWYDSDAVYSFAQILNAYKFGTAWSNTTLGISCDYSNKNAATLIGNIHGHIHNLLTDYIHFGNVVNGNKSEIWRMATPEACIGRANQYTDAWHEESTYAKTTGTAQDTAFCIYCIDLDTYTINAICYGAGYDRALNYSDGTQIITYSITNTLTNVSSDNSAATIRQGQYYTATLTASIEGDMTVTVTMGGTDVTDTVYADGVISIAGVTGNIVITAAVVQTEEPDEPVVTYTNQIPVSIDTDGSVYNSGQGWKTGYRLNSSGAEAAADGLEVTGFIPVKEGDIIRFKNIDFVYGLNSYAYCYITLYNSDFERMCGAASQNIPSNSDQSAYFISNILNESGEAISEGEQIAQFTITQNGDVSYMRISAIKIDETSIITVNEPIE